LLIFTACAPGQQRPIQQPNQQNQQQNEGSEEVRRNLETALSAIYNPGQVRHSRVTADTLDVKSGLGNNFSTITTLKKNDIVNVLDDVNDWYVIQLDDNQVGAIDSFKTTPVVLEGGNENEAQQPQPAEQPQSEDQVPIEHKTNQELQQQQQEQQQTQQPAQEQQQTQQNQQTNQPQPSRQTTTPTRLGSQEQRMVDLVNQERTKNGLAPLTVDLELSRVAAIKSQDMADNNYFSHNSPTYGSPFDMMDKFNIKYLHAGENLAGNSSVESAHTALMNSSGHRQNILSPDFTHIGIGIRPSDRYGYIYTQMFISKPK